jgi:toxin-antitoxin system PIN domain toxin
MKHLCDANFWIALTRATHSHHRNALSWLETLTDGDELIFCRATQQSYLRLLTTDTVTRQPRLTNHQALDTYHSLRRDSRVVWLDEPPGLEALWFGHASLSTASPKIWMDAYLASFAILCHARFVTFDRGFKAYKGLDWIDLNQFK